MSRLLRRLFGATEYSIIVSQYKRAKYGVGNEEHLHWSIVVITNEEDLEGRVYHAVNAVNRRTDEVTWSLSVIGRASLPRSSRCLGGVRIGTIKNRDMKHLDRALRRNIPVATHANWNCRDWVIECIEIMQERGWVGGNIQRQDDLFPAMRQASALTVGRGRPTVISF